MEPGRARDDRRKPRAPASNRLRPSGRRAAQRASPVDVVDNPRAIAILVDLPGHEKEEIEVEATGNAIRIFATRDTDPGNRDRTIRRERPERIERVIEPPASFGIEESEATYENGVLRITMPKARDERRRTIGIH